MKQLRERLYAYGSETLLTEELLAIILRGSPHEHVLQLASRPLVKYKDWVGYCMRTAGNSAKNRVWVRPRLR